MILEGLRFQILASGALVCAHDNTFAKYRHISESSFISKICLLRFLDMIHAYENVQNKYLAFGEFLAS